MAKLISSFSHPVQRPVFCLALFTTVCAIAQVCHAIVMPDHRSRTSYRYIRSPAVSRLTPVCVCGSPPQGFVGNSVADKHAWWVGGVTLVLMSLGIWHWQRQISPVLAKVRCLRPVPLRQAGFPSK